MRLFVNYHFDISPSSITALLAGRGGRAGVPLALLVIWPLTNHPFRGGAPFLLLIETPPTFWRSLRFFPYVTSKPFAYLIPFPLRRLWPPSISQDDGDRCLAIN